MRQRESGVVVIIPALNEELTIGKTIENVRKATPRAEIVVIDNASTDATNSIARKCGVKVLSEPRKGKGFAVQKGFDFALTTRANVVVLIDGDDTYGTEKLPEAISLVSNNGFDLVTGTRVPTTRDDSPTKLNSGSQFRPGHKLGNRFFEKLHNLLLPIGIKDVLSGWRVMSKRFIISFAGEVKGFEIEAQLNSHAYSVKAATHNLEVAYFARPNGSNSKLNTFKDGLKILRTSLRNFRNERPFLAFTVLSTPWILATTYFVYLPLTTYFDEGIVPYLPRLVTGVGTFLIAALLWISGVILERIRQVRVLDSLRIFHLNTFAN